MVRFLFGISCSFDFCVGRITHAGRTVFILFEACKRNQILPHAPKPPKTVMQSVMRRGIICGKERIIYANKFEAHGRRQLLENNY